MRENHFLAVDQGNSFFKLSLFVGEKLRESRRVPTDAAEEIFAIVDDWHPGCAAFCSVGRLDTRIVESLRLAVDGNLLVLSHSTPLPVKNMYSTPGALGLDRLVLAAGAASKYGCENVMIVDAGTAVTLDAVGLTGSTDSLHLPDGSLPPAAIFHGGRISPGLRLRFESLHDYTSALPLVEADGPMPIAGDSTETSIRSGVVLGLVDEIVGAFGQYSDEFGCSRVIITGGDAAILKKEISSRIPVDHVPDLMACGLQYIYKYNENK